MDLSGSNHGLLSRFTRLRRRPQQPLSDLTALYSQIANESIYYLKLEENKDYKKAVQGWKALNTHVLYELTQIDRNYPDNQSYSKDELSLQSGVKELYHKSLSHLERVSKLYEEELPKSGSAASSSTSPSTSFSKRPPPPPLSFNSRSMLKTLREPGRTYSRNQSLPISSAGSKNNVDANKINFTNSKPLPVENAFEGFDETQNLIDLSDEEDKEEADKTYGDESNHNKQGDKNGYGTDGESTNTFEFNVDDYFDNYVDLKEEELKRLETLNQLEGVNKDIKDLSLSAPALKPNKSTPVLTRTIKDHTNNGESVAGQKTGKLVSKTPRPIASKKPTAKATVSSANIPAKKTVPVAKRPATRRLKTTPAPVQQRNNSESTNIPTTKKQPVINARTTRNKLPVKKSTGVQDKPRVSQQPKKLTKPPANSLTNGTQRSQSPAKKKAVTVNQSPATSLKSDDTPSLSQGEDLKESLEDEIIEQLRGVDKTAAKQIFSEIVVHGDEVHWEDIAGLESAKNSLKEAVVYPFLRPDLFRGLREPVRGMLLFGPPGTGKTMLARAVATESNSTFFSISASSLTSKYLGESEKLVRALFAVAKKLSPSIVFVDEIDSIMGSRNNDGENESSRRIKNEFLVQWSSLSTAAAGNDPGEEVDERVLVLAATNLPWSIDEAARRRFVRRQYIPLPEPETRRLQFSKLLARQKHTLTDDDFIELLALTDGYSGSDITSLAKDAAMGPLRELGDKLLLTTREQIRPISLLDFKNSLNYIKPSVSKEGLVAYEEWASKFGSSGV